MGLDDLMIRPYPLVTQREWMDKGQVGVAILSRDRVRDIYRAPRDLREAQLAALTPAMRTAVEEAYDQIVKTEGTEKLLRQARGEDNP